MRDRIVEIAESAARLRLARGQLVIEGAECEASIPLDDIAVVIAAHPQISITQPVLTGLVEAGATFVTCNSSRLPVGLLLPLAGHSTQTERFSRQLELSRPARKQLWRQVVRAKIAMQAALLRLQCGSDHGIAVLARLVRSGDTTNVEARAARRYWTALFGSNFRRDRDAADHNRLLNYGYAILRAATARAICATGLHPSVGLHHHNRYNAWCLADDLMEPYRPLVDRAVCSLLLDEPAAAGEFDSTARRQLLGALTGNLCLGGQQRTLFDALSSTASSLSRVIMGDTRQLDLPEGLEYAAA